MAAELRIEDAGDIFAKVYLRVIAGGTPGAGKTYTMLQLATALAEREGSFVGVIETEHGRSAHYARQFPHKLIRLKTFEVETYIQAMGALFKAGCKVVIIDSMTHAWDGMGGVRDHVNAVAKEKFGGNTWSGWSSGKAQQRSLIDAIHRYPGHVLATCRMKMETAPEKVNGQTTYVKKGLDFTQEAGIEYEFDIALVMSLVAGSTRHEAEVVKSVLGEFLPVGRTLPADERIADAIFAWLDAGATREEAPPPPLAPPAQPEAPVTVEGARERLAASLREAGIEEGASRAPETVYYDEDDDLGDDDDLEDGGPEANGTGSPPVVAPTPPAPRRPLPEPEPRAFPSAPPGEDEPNPLHVPARKPDDPGTPAAERQITSLGKLIQALRYEVADGWAEGMTKVQAGELITMLSKEYGVKRHSGQIAAGGPLPPAAVATPA